MLIILERENIATPSRYIFVFVNEVFNVVIRVFPLQHNKPILMTDFGAKYSLEKFHCLGLQNLDAHL